MTVYVTLLRGINVGGHNKVSMNDLKELLSELGFHGVSSYIQSGNVVFKSDINDPLLIEKMIKRRISEKLSLNLEVITKPIDELSEIIKSTPFKETSFEKGEKIYVTFLSKKPSEHLIEKLKEVEGKGDKIVVEGNTAYILCKKGYSNTVYNNNFLERTLGVISTNRNFQTIKKLVEIGASFDSS